MGPEVTVKHIPPAGSRSARRARIGGIVSNTPKIGDRIPNGKRVEGAFSDMRPIFGEARQSSGH